MENMENTLMCLFTASTASRRKWWRACLFGSTPSPSRCRPGPSTPPSSSGSCRATASTPNGSAATFATPASLTPREERYSSGQQPLAEYNRGVLSTVGLQQTLRSTVESCGCVCVYGFKFGRTHYKQAIDVVHKRNSFKLLFFFKSHH